MTTIREDFEKVVERLTARNMQEHLRAGTTGLVFAWDMWQEAYKQYDKKSRGRPPKLDKGNPKVISKYDQLCKLMKIRKSPTTEAVRMVVFDGVSVPKAAEATGLKVRGVYTAVRRFKEGMAIAKFVSE